MQWSEIYELSMAEQKGEQKNHKDFHDIRIRKKIEREGGMETNVLELTSWEKVVYLPRYWLYLFLINLILRSPAFIRCQLVPSSVVKYAPEFQHSAVWKQCHWSEKLVCVLFLISLFQSIRVKKSL